MTRVYYREAVGALVVFDMTRLSTFQAVLKWKGDLDSKVRRRKAQSPEWRPRENHDPSSFKSPIGMKATHHHFLTTRVFMGSFDVWKNYDLIVCF